MTETKKRIVINVEEQLKRVAVLVDDVLDEIHIETKGTQGFTGNIFRGKVTRVMPGIEAAFVDIGLPKNGFLHISDILDERQALEDGIGEDPGDDKKNHGTGRRKGIEEYLKEDDSIMVQILKDPIGNKGVRLTTNLSLAGRYLVLLPRSNRCGISRRIENPAERRRLNGILSKVKIPKTMGCIVRTFGEGKNLKDFSKDLKIHTQLWRKIYKRYRDEKSPALLHTEHDLIKRVVRDMLSEDIDKLIVDNSAQYRDLKRYINTFFPSRKVNLERYRKKTPIFEAYDIERQVEKVFSRKVWLNCGGHLVIDKTEALIAIDVNTGKNVGLDDANVTILETNLEAADEVARQLRLRNMGGLIVIDFIDMRTKADRRKVYDAFKKALKRDKARANVLPISDLGLVEMTRQRDKESLGAELYISCPGCRGSGTVKQPDTVIAEIERNLKSRIGQKKARKVTVRAHPQIIELLKGNKADRIAKLLKESGVRIKYERVNGYRVDEWNLKLG